MLSVSTITKKGGLPLLKMHSSYHDLGGQLLLKETFCRAYISFSLKQRENLREKYYWELPQHDWDCKQWCDLVSLPPWHDNPRLLDRSLELSFSFNQIQREPPIERLRSSEQASKRASGCGDFRRLSNVFFNLIYEKDDLNEGVTPKVGPQMHCRMCPRFKAH